MSPYQRAIVKFASVVILTWTAALAYAQPPTGGMEVELEKFQQSCLRNPFLSSLHDCTCLTAGYRKAAAEIGATTRKDGIINSLMTTCPAPKQVIYNHRFKVCNDDFQHVRADHEQVCSCASEQFANEAYTRPAATLRAYEALAKSTLLACGGGAKTR
jgi:hypothetical protein